MSPESEELLMLSCRLGEEMRRPLTQSQLRLLMRRFRAADVPLTQSSMGKAFLRSLGIPDELSDRILVLSSESVLLSRYLSAGTNRHCYPLTLADTGYPQMVYERLSELAPVSLWIKGDQKILDMPKAALVGSRDLHPANREFAAEVGRQAACQGFALVSGNARGADQEAQNACLKAGGYVLSVVADALAEHHRVPHVLYVSLDGWDEPFSKFRALRRNYVIHSLGTVTIAAQCTLNKGGTWDGSLQNLKNLWSPFFCFRDGSEASHELEARGARLLDCGELTDFWQMTDEQCRLF